MTTDKFDNTDLEAFRGDTEIYSFSVTANGAALNLLGYSIVSQIRDFPGSSEVLFNSYSSSNIVDSSNGNNFTQGIVLLSIPAANTATLPEVAYYDMQGTLGSIVKTLAAGRIISKEQITS